METVTVKFIHWLCKDADEALVTITDGIYECACYCQPCHIFLGYKIKEPLLAYEPLGVVITPNKTPFFKKMIQPFAYEICAEVFDLNKGLVRVGCIEIDLDNALPGDLVIGDFINFNCTRLDFIK